MSICVWFHVLFFLLFFKLLFCPFDSDTLPSWRLHLQTLLAQFHVCNLKKTRRRKKNKMTQKQPPRWPRWVWMDFFLLCLVQGLRCLLENQHSSGILGRCTAMWLPDPNERCKPPSPLCVCGCACVREWVCVPNRCKVCKYWHMGVRGTVLLPWYVSSVCFVYYGH